ncbi:putative helicase HelY [Austwickia sp. TVS 96-490-7B]|uniref:DEAD/DEAH box helicase n=1 Tax=Austwickia sp. TVS 96-490-7B TaxID=2830843 RepID=UPI001C58FBCB|nr:DEAD/DEAH box helicase [Austwickia sp. TVS 96-490-7B]MBW3085407.1 putative helicase HelY [Austwickia sp. TVS 96-490-7B]
MSSPAERYARSRRRSRHPQVTEFAAGLDFQLDEFQERACQAVEDGRGVLVAAPTGSGKTVVGEFAVHLGLSTGRRAFYTTPIKALSNQKYHDLCRRHGNAQVGLLTGDSVINGSAPVVVMTTEVLRNMMYDESPTLDDLGFVVMDEVHYLADRFRGAVWEEVIIHLPQQVQVVSLSATVSNAEEFGAWLGQVRGDTEVVVEEFRPVPLWQHMMVGREICDLFVEGEDSLAPGHRAMSVSSRINPELLESIERRRRGSRDRLPRRRGEARGRRTAETAGRERPMERRVSRAEVVTRLERDGLLPAITFIFSRAGCDAAVQQLLAWGTTLIDEKEARAISDLVHERVSSLSAADLGVLGFADFLEGLTRGFAAHHAGMLPTFRELVEELFTQGRIKMIFATETLALGINMPARTVVLEKLVKFNGEGHADITPAEYTQLTGRAGRRGVDVEGHAVVLWNPQVDPVSVGGLASTRTYPLRSSFRPNPNMAANLVATFGRERARAVLETSFAQFQADRSVVGIMQTIRRHEEALAGYAESMTCHLGDFAEYAALRRDLSQAEKEAARVRASGRRARVAAWLGKRTPGEVLLLPTRSHGRQVGRAVVLTPATSGSQPVLSVLTEEARVRRIAPNDLEDVAAIAGKVRIPQQFHVRVVKDRRDLAATMRATVPIDAPASEPAAAGLDSEECCGGSAVDVEQRITELRRRMRAHPCHGCPDREHHARWGERWTSLQKETATLRRRVEGRTSSVARVFDRHCDVLAELGYLDADGMAVTAAGEQLRRIFCERDVLVAQCLRHPGWARLTPAELAATVSALVHEPRRDDSEPFPQLPTAAVEAAITAMDRAWSDLEDRAVAHGVTPVARPDAGIAMMIYRWASGGSLESVLRDSDLAAGDFVRRCKQLVDLLGQIVDVASPTVAVTARSAVTAVMRGVVAADRLD